MKKNPYFFFIVFMVTIFFDVCLYSQSLAPSEVERKKIVEKMDKQNLRFQTTAVIDMSKKMLRIPEKVKQVKGITIAKTPPEIEFTIIPLEHRFLNETPEGYFTGVWSSWSQGTYHKESKKFYGAVGSHRFYKPMLHLVEYDAQNKTIKTLPEINTFLGRSSADYGDGKIHGWLDFYNGADLYFCTYWCKYPEPSEAEFQSGYEGGCILSYNVITGQFTNYGVPLKRSSWPYHRVDTKRGMLYAVGMFGEFLAFDLKEKKVHFAGYPPPGMRWFWRTMLIDEATGFVYSSNNLEEDKSVHFIKYDPVKNRFYKMNSIVPPDSISDDKGQMRAHTAFKTKDGWFMGVSLGGELFRFYPDEDRVEDLGVCWPGQYRYTGSLAMSPDEKYVYYVPAAHGKAYLEGTPVIQYNTKTGERKVLSFLFPYYYDKYGYIPGGTYSVKLGEKGEKLFILFNGVFNEYNPEGGDSFGDPSVMVINIPLSERQ